MEHSENWIWLPEDLYPGMQNTRYSQLDHGRPHKYAVAAFSKSYHFRKPIRQVRLRFCGDTSFALFCNGRYIAKGPILPGGDFLEEYHPVPIHMYYATRMDLDPETDRKLSEGILDFHALVRMGPSRCYEYSLGHGGFFLTAQVLFSDGSTALLHTDSSWDARLLPEYLGPGRYDNSLPPEKTLAAREIPNIWNCRTAPIPPCSLEPLTLGVFSVGMGQVAEKTVETDMIYAAYLRVKARTAGELMVKLRYRELEEQPKEEEYRFIRDGEYLGLELQSIGRVDIQAVNSGCEDAQVTVELIRCCYPAPSCAITATSDPVLDQVVKTCVHTLKYCRQSIHLDSPKHCEPLACTGDYYVEALMTAFSFGDMRLAAFDVRRTAELLRHRDGRMFHTTYSLIWVQMLWDVYILTGERALLEECADALTLLLERFHRYVGDNGLPEGVPNYMFIDWLVPDGISLHHPPKALGQSCLCLYYYGALKTAIKIWQTLGLEEKAQQSSQRMEALHCAILEQLYDRDRQLFFEGLNTPSPEELICEWMPRNVEKRYYRKHANILAAYFGFFPRAECAALLERILGDDSLGQVQPWFCHFLLEAVYRNGLREKYTLSILEQWKAPVLECSRGLAEGFYKPEESYSFDHSHAWGGTPAYALPLALSGLEILEPGFRKIRLSPSLLGLSRADVEIPTPMGTVLLEQRQGAAPRISVPEGICLL